MSKEMKLVLPLSVLIPRKTKPGKKVIINMNIYRNLHPMVERDCKKLYQEAVRKYLWDNKEQRVEFGKTPVEVVFQYFKPTKRISDKSNVFAVQSKYCYDALVNLGYLEDDNDDIIKNELLLPTVHDPENPRVEFLIREAK